MNRFQKRVYGHVRNHFKKRVNYNLKKPSWKLPPPWPFQYRGLKVSSTVALDQILRGKKRNVDKWLVPILLKFTDRLRFGDDQSYIIP